MQLSLCKPPVSLWPQLGCAGLIALGLWGGIPASWAETAPPPVQLPAPPAAGTAAPSGSPYQPDRFSGRAARYYAYAWGIDSLSVKLMESGELIRFTYRVLDPNLAKPLADKRLKPALVDEMRGISLVVPEMENIGMLRQTSTPRPDRAYWVAFSNKGRLVKRGDHVNVVIGPFHADNLIVD